MSFHWGNVVCLYQQPAKLYLYWNRVLLSEAQLNRSLILWRRLRGKAELPSCQVIFYSNFPQYRKAKDRKQTQKKVNRKQKVEWSKGGNESCFIWCSSALNWFSLSVGSQESGTAKYRQLQICLHCASCEILLEAKNI